MAAHGEDKPWNEHDQQVFYRNVHTMKGSARGLGLDELVTVLHHMENLLNEGRLAEVPPIHAEAARIIHDLHIINDDILGRRSLQENVIELTLDDIEDAAQVFPGHDPLHGSFRKHIRLLAYSNVEKALKSEISMLPAIAARLGKETPQLRFEHDDYALSETLIDGLRRIFIHLIRNSLDHGLESTEGRRATGKNPKGLITVSLQELGADRIRIVYRDDGQGLQLDKIRVKAQSLGLDRTQDISSAEALANLIFLPSFSTKNEADEISGRGVGMDAVRAYMENLGGRVTLQVEAEKERAGYFPFSITMDVPRAFFTPLSSERLQPAFNPVQAAS
jgi:chemotaxis protein histidine kinase CheA